MVVIKLVIWRKLEINHNNGIRNGSITPIANVYSEGDGIYTYRIAFMNTKNCRICPLNETKNKRSAPRMRYYDTLNVYFLERKGTHAVTLSVIVTKGHWFSLIHIILFCDQK